MFKNISVEVKNQTFPTKEFKTDNILLFIWNLVFQDKIINLYKHLQIYIYINCSITRKIKKMPL